MDTTWLSNLELTKSRSDVCTEVKSWPTKGGGQEQHHRLEPFHYASAIKTITFVRSRWHVTKSGAQFSRGLDLRVRTLETEGRREISTCQAEDRRSAIFRSKQLR